MFEGKKPLILALLHILIILGFLSSCYHVCPTEENFQFDTTFMYCISVLVFLKVCRASLSLSSFCFIVCLWKIQLLQVYQFRHHDVTSTAHLVFLVIALALIFEVVGIFTSSVFFWVLFIFFYISFVLVFIIQVIRGSIFIQTTKSYNIFKMSDISQLVWT